MPEAEADAKKSWMDILDRLDTRTKVLGLICLIAEALFLAAIAKLEGIYVLWALFACLRVLCLMIYGIIQMERPAPQPAMVAVKKIYDVFVSIPMAAVNTEEDYQRYRNTALEVIKALKE